MNLYRNIRKDYRAWKNALKFWKFVIGLSGKMYIMKYTSKKNILSVVRYRPKVFE